MLRSCTFFLTTFLIIGCANVPLLREMRSYQRAPAEADADIYGERALANSPFQKIREINYNSISPAILDYVETRPTQEKYLNVDQRWAWTMNKANTQPENFHILDFQSDTSPQQLLAEAKRKNPKALKYLADGGINESWITHKKVNRLYAYQVSGRAAKELPTVLIWAKEHGDEFNTAEFVQEMADFFLFHLKGKGDPSLNTVIQKLFTKINLVVVPDMTPDKDFLSVKTHKVVPEDYNDFMQVLQPFNYDSENPDDYLAAPEAAFLRKLILNLKQARLGIDIHDPNNISVIADPAPSVAEANRFLIVEATHTAQCVVQYGEPKDRYIQGLCGSGVYRTEHEGISKGRENAASFFSRTKNAPSIFLELFIQNLSRIKNWSECHHANPKEQTCTYTIVREHLKAYIPYFLRLFEIIAYDDTIRPMP